MFATDSEADLRNIAREAPGSRIYVRILIEGTRTADWPLFLKFGCQSDMAMDLLVLSRNMGLESADKNNLYQLERETQEQLRQQAVEWLEEMEARQAARADLTPA
jgi:diaminopimelate decarboxylase